MAEIVLKVRSRCNIACDYCYVYELGDSGWKDQPLVMTAETAGLIASGCAEYGPDKLQIIFHGGEALMGGAEPLAEMAELFRAAMPDTRLGFGAQTNGTLFTRRMLGILQDAGISLGVSLDGDGRANDRHRLTRQGRSTYTRVVAGLELLTGTYPDIFGGLLGVIDLANDPAETYRHLAAWKPPVLGFLFPLATYDRNHPGADALAYGKWLAEVFEVWSAEPAETAPDIRLFHVIMDRLLGRDRRSGFIGPPPSAISIVFQPDGTAELVDSLAVVGNGVAKTGMNARDHALAEIAAFEGYRQPPAPAACQPCDVFGACGGGYWPTRFSGRNGYDNPSVYCEAYLRLIRHIRKKLEPVS